MLAWFRSQVDAHGLLPATRLLVRVVRYRIPAELGNRLLPNRLECPCCGWQGRRFLDYIEVGYRVPNAACPNCDSHPRHRGFHLWLRREFHLEGKQGRALIFAPERALHQLWQSARNLTAIKVDIEAARDVNLLADVMQLPLADESLDLVWCHHVLEQVVDDRAALRELYRVLKPLAGEMLISAGWTGREETQEFGYANKRLSGNQRLYGRDFGQRLSAAGFVVKPMTYNLSAAECDRYGVDEETFYYCTTARPAA